MLAPTGPVTVNTLLLLLVHAIAMLRVCALAYLGPTVRALRVEPAEALCTEV